MNIILDAGNVAWALTALLVLVGTVAGGLYKFGMWLLDRLDARMEERDDRLADKLTAKLDAQSTEAARTSAQVDHIDVQLTENLPGYRPAPRWPRSV